MLGCLRVFSFLVVCVVGAFVAAEHKAGAEPSKMRRGEPKKTVTWNEEPDDSSRKRKKVCRGDATSVTDTDFVS